MNAEIPETPPAGPSAGRRVWGKLLKRREFQAVSSKGVRHHGANFTLQLRLRSDAPGPRLGFTVTKKEGGAVERNRIRRRLKEAARLAGPGEVPPCDAVLLGRRAALDAPFQTLVADIKQALVTAVRRASAPRRRAPPAETTEE